MAVIFQDAFTGTSGTLVTAHTPNTGTSWTSLIFNGGGGEGIAISSNTADANSAGLSLSEGQLLTADATYSSANYVVKCLYSTSDSGDDTFVLAARIQDANNMYALVWNDDLFELYKKVSGTWSLIGSDLGAVAVQGDTIQLVVNGTNVKTMTNSVVRHNVTDSSISAAGKGGFGFGNVGILNHTGDDCSSQAIDDFEVNTTLPASETTKTQTGKAKIGAVNPWYIQHITGTNPSGTGDTVNTAIFGSNPVTGRAIVVAVAIEDASKTVNSVTDTAGNTYVKVDNISNTYGVELWRATNITGGSSFVVTATISSSGSRASIIAIEMSNIHATGFDRKAEATGSGASISTGNPDTTRAANEVIVAVAVVTSSSPTFTVGSGFADLITVSNGVHTLAIEAKKVSATGVYPGEFSVSPSNLSWATVVGTFANEDVSGDTTTTKTQTGVSRITIVTTKTQTGLSRITAATTKNQTGLSRITASTTKTQTGASRIEVSTTKTQTGLSRIDASTSKTQTGLASIQVGTEQTIFGTSNIGNLMDQTQLGVANIRGDTSKTQTGLSRIEILSEQTQTGLSRIELVVSRLQTGLSRITTATDRLQTGTADILATTSQTQTGLSRVLHVVDQTQTGISRISGTTDRLQTGISRLQTSVQKTQQGTAAILLQQEKNITGHSFIIEYQAEYGGPESEIFGGDSGSAQNRELYFKIEKLNSSDQVVETKTPVLIDGNVSVEYDRINRRTCNFKLAEALPTDWQSSRWKLYYGQKNRTTGDIDYVALGVFIPINPRQEEELDSYITSYQGVDKAQILKDAYNDIPLTFIAGTTLKEVMTEILDLVGETKRNLEDVPYELATDFTFEEGVSLEHILSTLVRSFPADWYYDREGIAKLVSLPPADQRAVKQLYEYGDNSIYVDSSFDIDTDRYWNRVIVVGGRADTGIFRQTYENEEQILLAGREVTRFFKEDAATSQDQVNDLATQFLGIGTQLPRQITISGIPIADLDVKEVIEKDLRKYEVIAFNVPLGLELQTITAGEIL